MESKLSYQYFLLEYKRGGFYGMQGAYEKPYFKTLVSQSLSDFEIMRGLIDLEYKYRKDGTRSSNPFESFLCQGVCIPFGCSQVFWRDVKQDFFEKFPEELTRVKDKQDFDERMDMLESRLLKIEQLLAAITDKITILAEVIDNQNITNPPKHLPKQDNSLSLTEL